VYLYFEYLKFLSIGFGIMSIIMIPALVCNIIGDYYGKSRQSYLDFTTLGNQKGFENGTSDPNAVNVDNENETLRIITIISDVLNTFVLYIYFLVFNAISRHKLIDLMRRKQTPSDYSIYVKGFPDDEVSREDIVKYFSKYGDIEEIVFARRFGKMMKNYMAQDKVNKDIKKREITVKIKAEKEGEGIKTAIKHDKKLMKLVKKDNQMEEDIRNKFPTIKSIDDVPHIGAFIVFNQSESAINCLKDHKRKLQLKTDETHKICEKYKVVVNQADEPSNILWENLEVSFLESFLRSLVVILVVILLLI